MSWWALLDEGSVIGGYVSVVGVLLQHINLQFNLLFFILDSHTERGREREKERARERKTINRANKFPLPWRGGGGGNFLK
jgi:hypothetical protein